MAAPLYGLSAQVGSIAAASVTASTVGTANTVITLSRDRRLLKISNTLNQPVMLAYNSADFFVLAANESCILDLSPAQLCMLDTKVLGIYHLGTQPTSGTLYVTAL